MTHHLTFTVLVTVYLQVRPKGFVLWYSFALFECNLITLGACYVSSEAVSESWWEVWLDWLEPLLWEITKSLVAVITQIKHFSDEQIGQWLFQFDCRRSNPSWVISVCSLLLLFFIYLFISCLVCLLFLTYWQQVFRLAMAVSLSIRCPWDCFEICYGHSQPCESLSAATWKPNFLLDQQTSPSKTSPVNICFCREESPLCWFQVSVHLESWIAVSIDISKKTVQSLWYRSLLIK